MRGSDHVEQHMADVRSRYGEVPITTVEKTVPNENFDIACKEAGEVVDVRVWVEREDNVLLIREHAAPQVWIEPGGTPESGESFETAAQREAAEETGIECTITGLRGIVRHEIRHENNPSNTALLLQLCYIAIGHSDTIKQSDDDIKDIRWWSTLPDQFHSDLGAPDSF